MIPGLILSAVMVWGVFWLSTSDVVDQVVDVNTLLLDRGRTVHLLGVQGTAEWDSVEVSELAEGGWTWAIVRVDTARVATLSDQVVGKRVKLEFTDFEPDSSSEDLHAYVFTPEGAFLNAWVVEQGLADVNPEHRHPRENELLALRDRAKQAGVGMWGMESEAAADTTVAADSLAAPADTVMMR